MQSKNNKLQEGADPDRSELVKASSEQSDGWQGAPILKWGLPILVVLLSLGASAYLLL